MRLLSGLLGVGAAAVLPLVLSATVLPGPHPAAVRVADGALSGQVRLVDDPQHPGRLRLSGTPGTTVVPARTAPTVSPLGTAAEASLAVSGLLVLAGAVVSAYAGSSPGRALTA